MSRHLAFWKTLRPGAGWGTLGLITVLLSATACIGEGGNGKGAPASEEKAAGPVLEGAAALFAAASPGVALVQTPAGSGAGLLVEGGYVLTAASLVTAGGPMRVNFTDGSSAGDAPLAAIDMAANVAALGPVKTSLKPVALAETKSIPPGSELYVIGYASGQTAPAISRAMLSSATRWEAGNLSLLQLDTPGLRMTGPAVVFTGAAQAAAIQGTAAPGEFATSAADLFGRIRALIDPKAGAKPAARLLSSGERRPVQKLEFDGLVTQRLAAFDAKPGAPVTLVLSGDAAASVIVTDATGATVKEGSLKAKEKLQLTLVPKSGGPHFAMVRLAERKRASFELSSDADLALFADPDDLHVIKQGQAYAGSVDFPGDTDILLIELVAGQTATVRVSSGRIDPLAEAFSDEPKLSVADDDSGGGVFGSDAIVQFKAPATGRYALQISDAQLQATGGYVLSVEGAASDAEVAATAAQIKGLIESIAADPRGATALQEILAGAAGQASPGLPAAYGAAWRGSAKAGVFVTDLATTDTTAGTGAQRTVSDPDGRFRVQATILARGQASVTLLVQNARGQAVGAASGSMPLSAACTMSLACLASVAFDVADAAANGPWTIALEPSDGTTESWQLEVRRDSKDGERPSLPAQK